MALLRVPWLIRPRQTAAEAPRYCRGEGARDALAREARATSWSLSRRTILRPSASCSRRMSLLTSLEACCSWRQRSIWLRRPTSAWSAPTSDGEGTEALDEVGDDGGTRCARELVVGMEGETDWTGGGIRGGADGSDGAPQNRIIALKVRRFKRVRSTGAVSSCHSRALSAARFQLLTSLYSRK